MMASCSGCGMTVPEGQRSCSMCYGDMDHGKDGYYKQWAEEQERLQQEQQRLQEEYRRE